MSAILRAFVSNLFKINRNRSTDIQFSVNFRQLFGSALPPTNVDSIPTNLSVPSFRRNPWNNRLGQWRSMFIQTQSTPNPLSLMFYPGKPVMEVGSADFPNARAAMHSPLAKALYSINGITRVFFGSDYITVTKTEVASWDVLKPEIYSAVMDFYSSGKLLLLDSKEAASMDTAITEGAWKLICVDAVKENNSEPIRKIKK